MPTVLAPGAHRARPHRPAPLLVADALRCAAVCRRARGRCVDAGGDEGGRAGTPDRPRVRPIVVSGQPSAPRLLAEPADGPRLGLRGGAGHRHRDRARASPAREDRGRPVAAALPRDGLGRRLPVLGVILFAFVVALATLAAGLAAAFALRKLPTAKLQVAALALLCALLPLAAVLLSGVVMFQSGHDLTILAVAVAASTAALGGALALSRSLSRPLEPLRDAAASFAAGGPGGAAPQNRPPQLPRHPGGVSPHGQ